MPKLAYKVTASPTLNGSSAPVFRIPGTCCELWVLSWALQQLQARSVSLPLAVPRLSMGRLSSQYVM